MNIDWKQVAQSEGYKSLKAAYVKDVQKSERYRARFNRKPMREKSEFLGLFKWVVCRAKHYAYHTGQDISDVLNEWETKRSYGILNYYQDARQPKLKSARWKGKKKHKRIKKAKWSMARKKRQRRYKGL